MFIGAGYHSVLVVPVSVFIGEGYHSVVILVQVSVSIGEGYTVFLLFMCQCS